MEVYMENLQNQFFDIVTYKKPKNPIKLLMYKYIMWKYFRDLSRLSPSFNTMVEMAAFIKLAETIWLYRNDVDVMCADLPVTYSKEGSIYILLMVSESTSCTIGLKQKTNQISISIKNTSKNEITSSIKFKDGELEIKSKIDEILFINILNALMKSFINLMKYCMEINNERRI